MSLSVRKGGFFGYFKTKKSSKSKTPIKRKISGKKKSRRSSRRRSSRRRSSRRRSSRRRSSRRRSSRRRSSRRRSSRRRSSRRRSSRRVGMDPYGRGYGRYESSYMARSRPSSTRDRGPPQLLRVTPQSARRGSALQSQYTRQRQERENQMRREKQEAMYQQQQRKEAEERVRQRIASEKRREQERARRQQQQQRQQQQRQQQRQQQQQQQQRQSLPNNVRQALMILGLPDNRLPDKNTLKQAYREAIFRAHPNRGGDAEKAKQITEAKRFLDTMI